MDPGPHTAKQPKLERISQRIVRSMAKHPEVFCLLFAVSFTFLSRYGRSLGNFTQRTVAQPPPKPFFPSTSPVIDYYHGNLGDVGSRLVDSQAMFVMYYAPWCAKSMEVRAEFDRAARYLQGEVEFAAINCWYPEGSCRHQNKFIGFPVLFFYHANLDGYEYKGVPVARYMIRFVENMIYPLTFLTSHEDLVMFMASKDNAVVGYFDFNSSPQPPGFMQYYYAAMRFREQENQDNLEFGVITNIKLAQAFEMKRSKTVFLIRSANDTLRYPVARNFTSSAIVQWINRFKQSSVVKWLLPSGVKSLRLSKEIEKGPALILFTKDAPLSHIHTLVTTMREVALSYRNCNNKSKVNDIIDTTTYLRWAASVQYLDLLEECRKAPPVKPPQNHTADRRTVSSMPHCCVSVVVGEERQSNSCDLCVNMSPGESPMSVCDISALSRLSGLRRLPGHALKVPGCSLIRSTYDPAQHITYCCDRYSPQGPLGPQPPLPRFSGFSSHLKGAARGYEVKPDESVDPFVRRALSNGKTRRCNQHRIQRLYGWTQVIDVPNENFQKNVLLADDVSFRGLQCVHNHSVNFYAMDPRLSREFAQRLGLNLRERKDTTTLVLVDKQHEVQYVMKQKVTTDNIVEFLTNYTWSLLPRSLRSAPNNPECNRTDGEVCLQEVTADTFHSLVMQEDKDVVLLYYGPWCGFCQSFTATYLSLAKYFQFSTDILFARINADQNELSWEYTADVYPQITIFPAYRKSESVTWPHHMVHTLSALVQFVLRHSTQSVKLQTGLDVCSRSCIQFNLHSSAERVHSLTREMHIISSRISRLQQRVSDYSHLIHQLEPLAEEDSSVERSIRIYSDRVEVLEDYIELLQLKGLRKQQQEKNARQLIKVLRSSNGFHIEKHKLVSIIKRYELFMSQWGAMDEEEEGEEEEVEEEEETSGGEEDRVRGVNSDQTEVDSDHSHEEL